MIGMTWAFALKMGLEVGNCDCGDILRVFELGSSVYRDLNSWSMRLMISRVVRSGNANCNQYDFHGAHRQSPSGPKCFAPPMPLSIF